MTKQLSKLREDWLRRIAEAMAPKIEEATGQKLPPFRIACGFPSRNPLKGGKKWTRGQCWSAAASADGHAEIFLNPGIADVETLAPIIAHELIHAALPLAGHKRPFQIAAKKIGHVAPFTTSNATEDFWAWAREIVEAAGPYPHAELAAVRAVGAAKAQTNRHVKAVCEQCGYTIRTARKWIAEKGAPICPEHFEPMICEGVELPGEGGEGEQ